MSEMSDFKNQFAKTRTFSTREKSDLHQDALHVNNFGVHYKRWRERK